jgi:hypothetical protein
MMVLFALAAAAASATPAPPPRIVEQARASVRIVSGVRVKLGTATADAQLRQTSFRDPDGTSRPAKFVEFQ